MTRVLWFVTLIILASSCSNSGQSTDAEYEARAERFFRGVYGGDPAVVKELAGDDIVLSYPVFENIVGEPFIAGREDVSAFVVGFGKRWAESQITVHESIAQDQAVVLVWSFSGRFVGDEGPGRPPVDSVQSWGGFSLFRFEERGLIVLEVGEESTPGPMGRLKEAESCTFGLFAEGIFVKNQLSGPEHHHDLFAALTS